MYTDEQRVALAHWNETRKALFNRLNSVNPAIETENDLEWVIENRSCRLENNIDLTTGKAEPIVVLSLQTEDTDASGLWKFKEIGQYSNAVDLYVAFNRLFGGPVEQNDLILEEDGKVKLNGERVDALDTFMSDVIDVKGDAPETIPVTTEIVEEPTFEVGEEQTEDTIVEIPDTTNELLEKTVENSEVTEDSADLDNVEDSELLVTETVSEVKAEETTVKSDEQVDSTLVTESEEEIVSVDINLSLRDDNFYVIKENEEGEREKFQVSDEAVEAIQEILQDEEDASPEPSKKLTSGRGRKKS